MSLQKNVRDLIFFYVKTNYNSYMTEKKLTIIPESEIPALINTLYDERKEHIKVFIIDSLKQLYSDNMSEYPGDRTVSNLLLNIFQDDELCKNRVAIEITLHQKKMRGESNIFN